MEKTCNSSMTYGQNMEKKIDIGRLDSGSYGPKLANQSDHGKVVKYGNSGLRHTCTRYVVLVSWMGRDIFIIPLSFSEMI